MPTYHYRCADCQHSFDYFQKFADDPLTDCPECGGPIRRVPQPVGIVFKGSGWYINDSRKGNGGSDASNRSAKTSASDEKPTASESSSEAKTEKPAAVATESKTSS